MKKTIIFLISFVSLFTFFCFGEERMPVLKVYYTGELIYEDYTPGSMILEDTDGVVTEHPAKFKTRGVTALQYTMKPSLNMKLETPEGEEIDDNLLGIRKASSFILDAMAIDRICMRNRVCFDIWNSYSKLPYETDFDSRNGTVGKFVIVYINDVYKGIYCLTDKINRKLLGLKKPQVADDGEVTIRGVLYKQGTSDIANQETPGFFNDYTVYIPRWHDAWELKEPEDYPGIPAWQPLIDFYDHFGNSQYVIDNFYEDNLVDYSLLIMALCISDNWGNKNKYFSMLNCQKADDAKFIVTPWDLDTSLGGHFNGDFYDGNYSHWSVQDVANSATPPFSICFSNNDVNVKEKMRQRWIEIRENSLSVEYVAGLMYGYCDLFEKSGAWQEQVEYWDTKGSRPKYVRNLRAEIDQIVDWYAERFNSMDDYFNIDASVSSLPYEYKDETIYNLQGIPVAKEKLMPGQIYIRNGKKFIAS